MVTAATPLFEKVQYQGHTVITMASILACADFGLCREQVSTVLEKCSHIVQVMSRGFYKVAQTVDERRVPRVMLINTEILSESSVNL